MTRPRHPPDANRGGRPPDLGVRRAHRVEIQLGDAERRELEAALLPGEPLAAYVRQAALTHTRELAYTHDGRTPGIESLTAAEKRTWRRLAKSARMSPLAWLRYVLENESIPTGEG